MDINNPAAIITVMLVAFVLLWMFVLFLLSALGGWRRLARRFQASQKVDGKKFNWQGGRFGFINYNGVLTIVLSSRGIYIEIFPLFKAFHPPLLIPWEAIKNVGRKRFFFVTFAKMDIDNITTIMLMPKLLESDEWQGEKLPEDVKT